MNLTPSTDAILLQVRRALQEMVNQLLTIAERMCTLAQDITPTGKAPPSSGNGFFAASAHKDSVAGDTYRQATTTGVLNYQESIERALRAEYERAGRAELELAILRA